MEVDVEKEALADIQPLVDSMSTNLTTFSGHGGKLIFYHGDDPWFSPLDTFDYYRDMSATNGGSKPSRSGASFTLFPAWRTAAEDLALISLMFWVRWSTGWRREPHQRQ
jgi:Tannase and feruloyl esterase